jgi:hypothetical protein
MSCELYISLTQSDFIDEQVRIHWALSNFNGGHVVSFAKCILWQELRSGKMCFTSWTGFTEEFVFKDLVDLSGVVVTNLLGSAS